jgi:DNA polymerase elongation subunit (family B)
LGGFPAFLLNSIIDVKQAIGLIEATTKWGAQVVYGDTDSLFIYLPGKTKEQAFRIGYDISDTITAMNPAPIKLKFEKVGYSESTSSHNAFPMTKS